MPNFPCSASSTMTATIEEDVGRDTRPSPLINPLGPIVPISVMRLSVLACAEAAKK